jgi:hypothetical protein
MAKLPWPDRLREALQRHALPAGYRSRLTQELSDHLADVQAEELSMNSEPTRPEERMGEAERLAATAAKEFTRRTFAGRHPFFTFMVSPVTATLGLFVAIALAGRGLAWLMMPASGVGEIHPPSTAMFAGALIEGYLLCLIPFGLGWIFLDLSRRVGRPAWGVAACGLLALLVLAFRPVIGLRFEVSLGTGGFLRPDSFVPFVLPLTFALWAWWRIHYPPTRSPSDMPDIPPTARQVAQ